MSDHGVPEVYVTKSADGQLYVYSTARCDKHTADTCACWGVSAMRTARRLLRSRKPIMCRDATARAAVISLGIQLLNQGTMVTQVSDITLVR